MIPALLTLLLLSAPALAGDQVGTITQLEGEVKLFSHPSKQVEGPPPHALFEGEYFSVQDARLGDRVEKGNIVRAHPGGKVRVIFDNGDQFNVAPATAFRISWDLDSSKGNTQMELRYGKLRGIVAPGGPRSRLKIRTRSAVMGVRGTDFFIAEEGSSGNTEVAVLRGQTEVTPQTPEAKPVQVHAGYKASVEAAAPAPEAPAAPAPGAPVAEAPAPAPAPAPQVTVAKATQTELHVIDEVSTVTKGAPALAEAPKEVVEQVGKLEEKAAKSTLEDIRVKDPDLFAKLEKEPPLARADLVNAQSVANLLAAAPSSSEKIGPIADRSLERGEAEKSTDKIASALSEEEDAAERAARRSSSLTSFELKALHEDFGDADGTGGFGISWNPMLRLWGNWLALRSRLGFVSLGRPSYATGTGGLSGIDFGTALSFRFFGHLLLEGGIEIESWNVRGEGSGPPGGPQFNAGWEFHQRLFGVMDRIFVGVTGLGDNGRNNSSNNGGNNGGGGSGSNSCGSGPGSGGGCCTGSCGNSNGNITEVHAGIGFRL